MPFIIGEIIGPYKLVEETGHGGMATVYKAYHRSLDRYVAIKAIQTAFVDDKDFLARFEREARVVARLEHPNIVPIYDYSQYEGQPYIVMKFIDGESLKERMKRGILSNNQILEILDAVGSALSYAHKQNVVHRDIKPANVLISRDGSIYLADFGLARLVQSGEVSITGDHMIGTPHYMSPEQAMGLSNIDNRTDIYALGIMLYEMVAGRVPFNAETPFTIIHDHIYTPPPPPHTFNTNVSPVVESILEKALSKNPGDRYPDISALVDSFRSFVTQTPLASLPASQAGKLSASQFGTDPIPQTPAHSSLPEWADRKIDPNKTRVDDEYLPELPIPQNAAGAPEPTPPLPTPAAAGKKGNRWIFILAAVSAIFICASISFIAYRFRAKQIELQATQTASVEVSLQSKITQQVKTLELTPVFTPTLQPTLASNSETDKIIPLIDNAAKDWNTGRIADAKLQLQNAINLSNGDATFNDTTLNELGKQNAWGLAVFFLVNSEKTQPIESFYKHVDKIHEVLYKGASDPNSAEFIRQYPANPMLTVAAIRYQLYFGDKLQARNHLDKVLANPQQVKRFPEAKLLDAEYDIQTNNVQSARIKLKNLLQDSANLSKWIIDEAQRLESVQNPS